MENKIKQQQDAALEVLHKLEITDSNCILAGGAPREWWFEKEANDLDFYVFWGENTTCNEDKLRLSRLGFSNVKMMGRNPLAELYGSIPELRRVWEIEYKGEQVQIMVMSAPTFNCVINRFGCSVSQVWWKGSIQVTESFLMSHHLKVNIIKGDYNAKETYVKKMTERYPEYEVFEESSHKDIKSSFVSSTKTSLWMLNNLGNKQTYKNSKQLFENEFDYKAFKEFLNYGV